MSAILNSIARIRTVLNRDDGQALAETSLVLAFVALVCILAVTALGLGISGELGRFAAVIGVGGDVDPVVVNQN